jgi:hypothetical protein
MQQLWPFVGAIAVGGLLLLALGRERLRRASVALDVVVFAVILTFLSIALVRLT